MTNAAIGAIVLWALVVPLAVSGMERAGADLAALRSKIGGDHAWMMWASISALSPEVREYAEPELELLIRHYTHFPDSNWSNQGTWGGWSGFPDSQWYPNRRREWGISQACGWSPVSGQGKHLYLHGPPGAYTGVRVLLPQVVELLKQGRHGDAMRKFGAMSHAIQDSATFPHMQALHRVSRFRHSGIGIPGYEPIQRADTPEAAADALAKRVEEMVHFTEALAPKIRDAMSKGDWERNSALRIQCCNEAAKIVADAFHTAAALAGPKPPRPAHPLDKNLIENGNVEQDDFGEPAPAGWVPWHNDPKDRLGRVEWEGVITRNQNLARSGRHSLKMMWAGERGLEWRQTWPASLFITPGERYRASAWVRTYKATGETRVVVEFASRAAQRVSQVGSAAVDGTHEWRQLLVEATAPPGAERLRVIVRSRQNEGAVWFDDVELARVDPAKSETQDVFAPPPAAEDRCLWLTFDEGQGTCPRDRSPYRGLNGPNVLVSAGKPANLFVKNGRRGCAVALDGVDDFVECPASYIQDVQCPAEAMTLMLWVWADEHRDAVLVSKEQLIGQGQWRGYRVGMGADGNASLLVHTDAGDLKALSGAAIPLGQWAHVAAVRSGKNALTVYVNGKPGPTTQARGAFLPTQALHGAPASLYIGAAGGARQFFKGKVEELLLLNRALDPEEVAERAGAQ